MSRTIASIGFGEAARAFSGAWRSRAAVVRAYDLKLNGSEAAAMRCAIADHGAVACASASAAVAGADAVFSLVTADAAIDAARGAAAALAPGMLWLDMNSVAPETKRMAAAIVEAQGALYCDVAVMAPVHPAGANVAMLVCGPHAAQAVRSLATIGFGNARVVDGPVGSASAIKMIRSVMVKGIEALSAECLLAAAAAGVTDDVIASLDASWPGMDWAGKADYNLDRMLVHGLRRAAEMAEVVKTLDALGTGSMMSRATVDRQHELGTLGLAPSPTLAGKLQQLLGRGRSKAA